MNTVLIAMQNELRKIFWRPKYCVMLFIYAAVGLGAGFFSTTASNLGTASQLIFSVRGPNALYSALSTYRTLLIPLVVFMLSADVLTHELESKSIKCVLVRPVSRFDVYLAKCLAMLCYIAIALGVGFLIVATRQIISAILASNAATATTAAASPESVFNMMFGNPPPSYAQNNSALSVASMLTEAFASYLLTLAPMAAFIAFASFVAVLIHSPALVMFLCIVSYLALSIFSTFNTAIGAALFTSYSGWYRMWLGDRLPWQSLLTTAGILLSTIVAFFGFGFFIFDKKDI